MTWTLSGFADEISPELEVQLETLRSLGISHLELRSVWGDNVTALSDEQLGRVERALKQADVSVSAIGSPIGKVPVDAPVDHELERLRRVAQVAHQFGTRLVRVFSFFIPEGHDPDLYREQVLERLGALASLAEAEGLVLAHENEKKIFGDIPRRCADLITSVSSPALRATFDAANFVQCGVRPFTEGYPLLRPHLVYLQVKDAKWGSGEVTAAGQGDGQVEEMLEALAGSGFDGYVSLEPHLAEANDFGGFSGPEAFIVAADALKGLLARLNIDWR